MSQCVPSVYRQKQGQDQHQQQQQPYRIDSDDLQALMNNNQNGKPPSSLRVWDNRTSSHLTMFVRRIQHCVEETFCKLQKHCCGRGVRCCGGGGGTGTGSGNGGAGSTGSIGDASDPIAFTYLTIPKAGFFVYQTSQNPLDPGSDGSVLLVWPRVSIPGSAAPSPNYLLQHEIKSTNPSLRPIPNANRLSTNGVTSTSTRMVLQDSTETYCFITPEHNLTLQDVTLFMKVRQGEQFGAETPFALSQQYVTTFPVGVDVQETLISTTPNYKIDLDVSWPCAVGSAVDFFTISALPFVDTITIQKASFPTFTSDGIMSYPLQLYGSVLTDANDPLNTWILKPAASDNQMTLWVQVTGYTNAASVDGTPGPTQVSQGHHTFEQRNLPDNLLDAFMTEDVDHALTAVASSTTGPNAQPTTDIQTSSDVMESVAITSYITFGVDAANPSNLQLHWDPAITTEVEPLALSLMIYAADNSFVAGLPTAAGVMDNFVNFLDPYTYYRFELQGPTGSADGSVMLRAAGYFSYELPKLATVSSIHSTDLIDDDLIIQWKYVKDTTNVSQLQAWWTHLQLDPAMITTVIGQAPFSNVPGLNTRRQPVSYSADYSLTFSWILAPTLETFTRSFTGASQRTTIDVIPPTEAVPGGCSISLSQSLADRVVDATVTWIPVTSYPVVTIRFADVNEYEYVSIARVLNTGSFTLSNVFRYFKDSQGVPVDPATVLVYVNGNLQTRKLTDAGVVGIACQHGFASDVLASQGVVAPFVTEQAGGSNGSPNLMVDQIVPTFFIDDADNWSLELNWDPSADTYLTRVIIMQREWKSQISNPALTLQAFGDESKSIVIDHIARYLSVNQQYILRVIPYDRYGNVGTLLEVPLAYSSPFVSKLTASVKLQDSLLTTTVPPVLQIEWDTLSNPNKTMIVSSYSITINVQKNNSTFQALQINNVPHNSSMVHQTYTLPLFWRVLLPDVVYTIQVTTYSPEQQSASEQETMFMYSSNIVHDVTWRPWDATSPQVGHYKIQWQTSLSNQVADDAADMKWQVILRPVDSSQNIAFQQTVKLGDVGVSHTGSTQSIEITDAKKWMLPDVSYVALITPVAPWGTDTLDENGASVFAGSSCSLPFSFSFGQINKLVATTPSPSTTGDLTMLALQISWDTAKTTQFNAKYETDFTYDIEARLPGDDASSSSLTVAGVVITPPAAGGGGNGGWIADFTVAMTGPSTLSPTTPIVVTVTVREITPAPAVPVSLIIKNAKVTDIGVGDADGNRLATITWNVTDPQGLIGNYNEFKADIHINITSAGGLTYPLSLQESDAPQLVLNSTTHSWSMTQLISSDPLDPLQPLDFLASATKDNLSIDPSFSFTWTPRTRKEPESGQSSQSASVLTSGCDMSSLVFRSDLFAQIAFQSNDDNPLITANFQDNVLYINWQLANAGFVPCTLELVRTTITTPTGGGSPDEVVVLTVQGVESSSSSAVPLFVDQLENFFSSGYAWNITVTARIGSTDDDFVTKSVPITLFIPEVTTLNVEFDGNFYIHGSLHCDLSGSNDDNSLDPPSDVFTQVKMVLGTGETFTWVTLANSSNTFVFPNFPSLIPPESSGTRISVEYGRSRGTSKDVDSESLNVLCYNQPILLTEPGIELIRGSITATALHIRWPIGAATPNTYVDFITKFQHPCALCVLDVYGPDGNLVASAEQNWIDVSQESTIVGPVSGFFEDYAANYQSALLPRQLYSFRPRMRDLLRPSSTPDADNAAALAAQNFAYDDHNQLVVMGMNAVLNDLSLKVTWRPPSSKLTDSTATIDKYHLYLWSEWDGEAIEATVIGGGPIEVAIINVHPDPISGDLFFIIPLLSGIVPNTEMPVTLVPVVRAGSDAMVVEGLLSDIFSSSFVVVQPQMLVRCALEPDGQFVIDWSAYTNTAPIPFFLITMSDTATGKELVRQLPTSFDSSFGERSRTWSLIDMQNAGFQDGVPVTIAVIPHNSIGTPLSAVGDKTATMALKIAGSESARRGGITNATMDNSTISWSLPKPGAADAPTSILVRITTDVLVDSFLIVHDGHNSSYVCHWVDAMAATNVDDIFYTINIEPRFQSNPSSVLAADSDDPLKILGLPTRIFHILRSQDKLAISSYVLEADPTKNLLDRIHIEWRQAVTAEMLYATTDNPASNDQQMWYQCQIVDPSAPTIVVYGVALSFAADSPQLYRTLEIDMKDVILLFQPDLEYTVNITYDPLHHPNLFGPTWTSSNIVFYDTQAIQPAALLDASGVLTVTWTIPEDLVAASSSYAIDIQQSHLDPATHTSGWISLAPEFHADILLTTTPGGGVTLTLGPNPPANTQISSSTVAANVTTATLTYTQFGTDLLPGAYRVMVKLLIQDTVHSTGYAQVVYSVPTPQHLFFTSDKVKYDGTAYADGDIQLRWFQGPGTCPATVANPPPIHLGYPDAHATSSVSYGLYKIDPKTGIISDTAALLSSGWISADVFGNYWMVPISTAIPSLSPGSWYVAKVKVRNAKQKESDVGISGRFQIKTVGSVVSVLPSFDAVDATKFYLGWNFNPDASYRTVSSFVISINMVGSSNAPWKAEFDAGAAAAAANGFGYGFKYLVTLPMSSSAPGATAPNPAPKSETTPTGSYTLQTGNAYNIQVTPKDTLGDEGISLSFPLSFSIALPSNPDATALVALLPLDQEVFISCAAYPSNATSQAPGAKCWAMWDDVSLPVPAHALDLRSAALNTYVPFGLSVNAKGLQFNHEYELSFISRSNDIPGLPTQPTRVYDLGTIDNLTVHSDYSTASSLNNVIVSWDVNMQRPFKLGAACQLQIIAASSGAIVLPAQIIHALPPPVAQTQNGVDDDLLRSASYRVLLDNTATPHLFVAGTEYTVFVTILEQATGAGNIGQTTTTNWTYTVAQIYDMDVVVTQSATVPKIAVTWKTHDVNHSLSAVRVSLRKKTTAGTPDYIRHPSPPFAPVQRICSLQSCTFAFGPSGDVDLRDIVDLGQLAAASGSLYIQIEPINAIDKTTLTHVAESVASNYFLVTGTNVTSVTIPLTLSLTGTYSDATQRSIAFVPDSDPATTVLPDGGEWWVFVTVDQNLFPSYLPYAGYLLASGQVIPPGFAGGPAKRIPKGSSAAPILIDENLVPLGVEYVVTVVPVNSAGALVGIPRSIRHSAITPRISNAIVALDGTVHWIDPDTNSNTTGSAYNLRVFDSNGVIVWNYLMSSLTGVTTLSKSTTDLISWLPLQDSTQQFQVQVSSLKVPLTVMSARSINTFAGTKNINLTLANSSVTFSDMPTVRDEVGQRYQIQQTGLNTLVVSPYPQSGPLVYKTIVVAVDTNQFQDNPPPSPISTQLPQLITKTLGTWTNVLPTSSLSSQYIQRISIDSSGASSGVSVTLPNLKYGAMVTCILTTATAADFSWPQTPGNPDSDASWADYANRIGRPDSATDIQILTWGTTFTAIRNVGSISVNRAHYNSIIVRAVDPNDCVDGIADTLLAWQALPPVSGTCVIDTTKFPLLDYASRITLTATTVAVPVPSRTNAQVQSDAIAAVQSPNNVWTPNPLVFEASVAQFGNLAASLMIPEAFTILDDAYSHANWRIIANTATGLAFCAAPGDTWTALNVSLPAGIAWMNACGVVAYVNNDVVPAVSKLFVVDAGSNKLICVNMASAATAPYTATVISEVQLLGPAAIAISPADGTLYIADTGHHRIVRVKQPTATTTHYAWEVVAGSSDGLPGSSLDYLDNPMGLAVARVPVNAPAQYQNDVIYICDTFNHRIVTVDTSNVLSPNQIFLGSTGIAGFTSDGPVISSTTQISSPMGISVAPSGYLVFVDGSNRVREITTKGVMTTILGAGATSVTSTLIRARWAQITAITAVVIAQTGGIYVLCDSGAQQHKVLLINGAPLPSMATLSPSAPKVSAPTDVFVAFSDPNFATRAPSVLPFYVSWTNPIQPAVVRGPLSYTITWTPIAGSTAGTAGSQNFTAAQVINVTGVQRTAEILNFTAGATYTFGVVLQAMDADGTTPIFSNSTSSSSPIQMLTVPTNVAVANLSAAVPTVVLPAVPNPGYLILSWDTLSDIGGSVPVLPQMDAWFAVTVSGGSSQDPFVTNWVRPSASAFSQPASAHRTWCTIPNMPLGSAAGTYTFTVTCQNARGSSTVPKTTTNPLMVVPAPAPGSVVAFPYSTGNFLSSSDHPVPVVRVQWKTMWSDQSWFGNYRLAYTFLVTGPGAMSATFTNFITDNYASVPNQPDLTLREARLPLPLSWCGQPVTVAVICTATATSVPTAPVATASPVTMWSLPTAQPSWSNISFAKLGVIPTGQNSGSILLTWTSASIGRLVTDKVEQVQVSGGPSPGYQSGNMLISDVTANTSPAGVTTCTCTIGAIQLDDAASVTITSQNEFGANPSVGTNFPFTLLSSINDLPPMVSLGADLGLLTVFSGTSTSIAATAAASSIVGNLGVNAVSTGNVTGFGLTSILNNVDYGTSSYVTGQVYTTSFSAASQTMLSNASSRLGASMTDAATRVIISNTGCIMPDSSTIPATFTRGIYRWSGDCTLPSSTLTLSGSATDVWIFQIGGNLSLASSATITLTGGASAANVFWQVAGTVNLATHATFKGIVLARGIITLNDDVHVTGRLFSNSAVNFLGTVSVTTT